MNSTEFLAIRKLQIERTAIEETTGQPIATGDAEYE